MAAESQSKGKKRSKAFYRKSAYGSNKKHCTGSNVLLPGIRGFLVMCNHDERSAVRESYNILNDYADDLYGPDKNAGLHQQLGDSSETGGVPNSMEDDEDSDDVEMALKKEVEGLKKAASSPQRRFQNVATKAKNCVFIRTALSDPVEIGLHIMKDIAEKRLKRARYAARIVPVVGTCRANAKEIEKLAADVLSPIFSKENDNSLTAPSFTVLFKMRNNNGTSCGRESVIPLVINAVKEINPEVQFSWTDYSIAIIVEVVCTVCCICVAPDYIRLRKYNLQELTQGPKCLATVCPSVAASADAGDIESDRKNVIASDPENENTLSADVKDGQTGDTTVSLSTGQKENEDNSAKCVDNGNESTEGVGCVDKENELTEGVGCVDKENELTEGVGCVDKENELTEGVGCIDKENELTEGVGCVDKENELTEGVGCVDKENESTEGVGCVDKENELTEGVGCVDKENELTEGVGCVDKENELTEGVECVDTGKLID